MIEYLVDENILYKTKGLYPTIRVNDNVNSLNIDIDVIKEIMELELEKKVKIKEKLQHDENFHSAWERWTEQEDLQLIKEFKQGLSIKEIADIHQRKIGGIRSRLKKHGLID